MIIHNISIIDSSIILCGDLNAEPSEAALHVLKKYGFKSAYEVRFSIESINALLPLFDFPFPNFLRLYRFE